MARTTSRTRSARCATALARGGVTAWNLPSGVPLFSWAIRINAISAYFNLALGILGAAVSVYSFGYVRQMEGRRNIGVLGCFYNVLLLSLTLVFVAGLRQPAAAGQLGTGVVGDRAPLDPAPPLTSKPHH